MDQIHFKIMERVKLQNNGKSKTWSAGWKKCANFSSFCKIGLRMGRHRTRTMRAHVLSSQGEVLRQIKNSCYITKKEVWNMKIDRQIVEYEELR